MAKPEIRSEGDAFREAFHQRMHANNMYGLWELASQMTPQPQPKMVPHMWPWSTTESIIEESARAVPVGDERRALQLFNPGLKLGLFCCAGFFLRLQLLLRSFQLSLQLCL